MDSSFDDDAARPDDKPPAAPRVSRYLATDSTVKTRMNASGTPVVWVPPVTTLKKGADGTVTVRQDSDVPTVAVMAISLDLIGKNQLDFQEMLSLLFYAV